ncbi:MAG TPA: LLM class flavin-dependent oxidoreductase, partial [Gammaproteobacteria bacterium]|nr:LLM class flavin-dependent oxidoreductase [Gammaproteobacteria bacterium]
LDQVELADNLGIDFVWEVEHHFLEEYAHSSAPEVFLAACSQRTKNIRLGHGIKLMPPNYNHPARVAEEIATLDLVSNGRVEFGTGESSSLAELGGFKIPVEEKRNQWLEAVEQTCNMMTMEPYPGYEGKYFSMPCRNVLPKPTQKPHPPLWVACSNRETIKLAAKLGIGALTFAFVDPEEAKHWVNDYYRILKEECIPIGHTINPNIAMVTSFGCHKNHDEAVKRMKEGFQFFSYGLGHHYIFGINKPGRTNIWKEFQKNKIKTEGRSTIELKISPDTEAPGIGTPEELSAYLKKFEKTGVDQVTFIQQGGRNKHEHICEALELFASDVMPEFKEREANREKEKMEELTPYLKKAMKRKKWMAELKDDEIPDVEALGRQIIEASKNKEVAK